MKCDYCGEEDHLVTACGPKTVHRNLELGGGCFVLILLALPYVLGFAAGGLASAFMSGFKLSSNIWDMARGKLRGKKDESTEV